MKFKIPANTELEDKILPFLTIRQLIILSIGATICYLIFQILFSLGYVPMVWGTINFIIGSLFVAAAFLKINHLEFHRWIALLISKIFIPQKRFFNNGLVGGQNFDVLNIVSSVKNNNNLEENLKKLKKIKTKEEENNLNKMKKEIFGNNQNNFNYLENDENLNLNFDFDEDEQKEFGRRFG